MLEVVSEDLSGIGVALRTHELWHRLSRVDCQLVAVPVSVIY